MKLTNSEVTVEALHEGLPGYLRIRGDTIILDHSVVNSQVNNVTNVLDSQGRLIDVVGAGRRARLSRTAGASRAAYSCLRRTWTSREEGSLPHARESDCQPH